MRIIRVLNQASTRRTHQLESILGSDQKRNNAGGFGWCVDDWMQLDRFLILGTEGGTYYVGERALTRQNAEAVERCVKADGPRVVKRVVEISTEGRAPKNDPALFVLAMCSALGDTETRRAAFAALPEVARIGTHLFHFAQFREAFGGWGRGMRCAAARWYTAKTADQLAYQAVKYQQRDGWSHRDVLRLSHPKPPTAAHSAVYRFMTGFDGKEPPKGRQRQEVETCDVPRIISAFEELKGLEKSPKAAAKLIAENNLPREAVPTGLLRERIIWETLLQRMPMTATIRNLATMTKIGLLEPMSDAEKTVIARITDGQALRKARVHPIQVLSALKTYAQGHGERSSARWTPCPKVIDALDDAFYASFGNVNPTGKKLFMGIDVSGSMGEGEVAGVPGLTPRVAAAALAMVTARVESDYHIMGFCHELVPLAITPRMRLDDAVKLVDRADWGGTDCALPMLHALERKLEIDAFLVYTDSETWFGKIHPAQALGQYRRKMNFPWTKLAVVGMVANRRSIADPNDAGMLDIVGFDTATPRLIEEFVRD